MTQLSVPNPDAESIAEQANKLFDKSAYANALALFLQISNQDSPLIFDIKIAACQMHLGKSDLGLIRLQNRVERGERDRLLYVWLGKLQLKMASYKAACEYFDLAIKLYQPDVGIARDYVLSAALLCMEDRSPASVRFLSRAIGWSFWLPATNEKNFSLAAQLLCTRILALPYTVLRKVAAILRHKAKEQSLTAASQALFCMYALQIKMDAGAILKKMDEFKGAPAEDFAHEIRDLMIKMLTAESGGKFSPSYKSLLDFPPASANLKFNEVPFIGLNTFRKKVDYFYSSDETQNSTVFDVQMVCKAPDGIADSVVLVAADRKYTEKYAPRLIAGIKNYDEKVSFHLNIVCSTQDDIHFVKSIAGKEPFSNIGISYVVAPFLNSAYYAMNRFLVAEDIINVYGKSVVIIDVDGVVNTNPVESLEKLEKMAIDFGIGTPKGYCRALPWLSFAGGFVYINKAAVKKIGLKKMLYESFFSRALHQEILAKDSLLWMLDQTCLFEFICQQADKLNIGDITKLRFYTQPLGHK